MGFVRTAIAAAVIGSAQAAHAFAQSATLAGVVTSHSHAVADAEVVVEGTAFKTRTDGAGEYRIRGVPPGTYVVDVHMIGYRGAHESVVVGSGIVRCDVALVAQPTAFVAAVSATAPPTSTSMQISRVESPAERPGRFLLSSDVLRASESRMAADLLAGNFTELRTMRREPSSAYAYAERPGATPAQQAGPDRALRAAEALPSACYLTLYVDGKLVYDLDASAVGAAPAREPPDVNAYHVADLSAVEFYPGDAALPLQYHTGGCGTLLFWSRQK